MISIICEKIHFLPNLIVFHPRCFCPSHWKLSPIRSRPLSNCCITSSLLSSVRFGAKSKTCFIAAEYLKKSLFSISTNVFYKCFRTRSSKHTFASIDLYSCIWLERIWNIVWLMWNMCFAKWNWSFSITFCKRLFVLQRQYCLAQNFQQALFSCGRIFSSLKWRQ